MADSSDLDALVRRVDPDRWLASRFIEDAAVRADVIAVYALNHELVHIAEAVRDPFVGEIRLSWWREGLDGVFAGDKPRPHPVLGALRVAVDRRAIDRAAVDRLVQARSDDLEPRRFADEAALDAYIDDTAGAIMTLAAGILGAEADPAIQPAARAWALTGMQRNRNAGLSDRLPTGWGVNDVYGRVTEALALAQDTARAMPIKAFPAIVYAALAKPYAAGRSPSELERRLRLLAAVMTGRL